MENKPTEEDKQETKKKETAGEEVGEESERDTKERKKHEMSLFIRKGLHWRQIEVREWIKKKIGEGWWAEKVNDNILRIDFDEVKKRKRLWKWHQRKRGQILPGKEGKRVGRK